jgi:hypothetical protein
MCNIKDKINIQTGITKEQALKMAKNLDFKGNKVEIVGLTTMWRFK